jgi:hypothetical protein
LRRRPLLAALLAALPAGCGDLPRPFAGNPGATARRLSRPPPSRLAVVPPATALLPDAGALELARGMATALQAYEVPAVAESPKPSDWRLATRAELRGSTVVPIFTVQNPAGDDQGAAEGAPVPSSAWAEGSPALLRQVADGAAPGIAQLLTRIEAARRESDPESLVNRPARVFFKGVRGAPGDGDTALARQMRQQLPKLGPVVQDTDAGADFLLECDVATAPVAGNLMRVEIVWRVADANGRESGKVVQLNDVPPASVNRYWGDVAVVVAQEAAGGIRDVILRQTGSRKTPSS